MVKSSNDVSVASQNTPRLCSTKWNQPINFDIGVSIVHVDLKEHDVKLKSIQ